MKTESMTTDNTDRMLGKIRALPTPGRRPSGHTGGGVHRPGRRADGQVPRRPRDAPRRTNPTTNRRPCSSVGRYALDKQHLLSAVAEAIGCRTSCGTRGSTATPTPGTPVRLRLGPRTHRAPLHLPTRAGHERHGENAGTALGTGRRIPPLLARRFHLAIVTRLREAEKRAQAAAENERPVSAGPCVALVLADRATVVQAR